jgi:dTDP-glucose 4,6-dehydratase
MIKAYSPQTILITGGAGFIGSHVVRKFVRRYPEKKIINLDLLTYAGNLENLWDIEQASNYTFIKGDIADQRLVQSVFEQYHPDGVINLAAESHVDRSLDNPSAFAQTNILGTLSLLQAARAFWGNSSPNNRFYQISTDEVYGSAEDGLLFTEHSPIDPRSPYSASKASADHFVKVYYNSFNLPVLISRCSNNYGPNHFPEKLIPLMIHNIIQKKSLPVYGKGENIRDWLFVEDHASAIDVIFHGASPGSVYNIGGNNEWKNIELVKYLCRLMDSKLGRHAGESESLISYVTDRPGHDLRYAIDSSKLQSDLGWKPSVTFEQGLEKTVDWYLKNQDWLEHVTTGAYQDYYRKIYQR